MKKVQTKKMHNKYFHGLISQPENSIKSKIIIHIHGLAGSYVEHNLYRDMHSYYPANGICFLAVEHSGSGEKAASVERFEDCVDDIFAWVKYAKNLGYSEIWLQSHSLGTPKAAYYMNQVAQNDVTGLIFLSPSEMIGLVHDPVGQLDYDVIYPEAMQLIQGGKPNQILSHKLWGTVKLSAGTFLNLFENNSNTAVFNYAYPNHDWVVVNNLKVPVLAITGTRDDGIVTVMDAHIAMDKLKLELKNSPRVKTIVYENAEHDFVGYEKNIVKDVVNFVHQS